MGANERTPADRPTMIVGMKAFATETRIDATPERVWSTLLDVSRWPTFDPAIERVDGTPALGARMTAHTTRSRAFPMTVRTLLPEQQMVLVGGMPLGLFIGLFKGQRTYTLDPTADGSVRFSMREEFSGLLAPLIERSIPDMQPSFDAFAANLKAASESAAS
jgi:hypothetical protein